MELNGMASFPGLVVCGGARALSSITVTIGKHLESFGVLKKANRMKEGSSSSVFTGLQAAILKDCLNPSIKSIALRFLWGGLIP